MTNYRGHLQELCRNWKKPLPIYDTTNTGSDHKPIWFSTCKALGYSASGTGSTVKEANSNASKILLNMLSETSIGNKEYLHTTPPKDVKVTTTTPPKDVKDTTTPPKDVKDTTQTPHIAKLMFAAVETDWDPILIDHRYLNLQMCFKDMWQWEYEFSVFDQFGRIPDTPGEWYKCFIHGFSLVFHCPDGKPPTKDSAILFG